MIFDFPVDSITLTFVNMCDILSLMKLGEHDFLTAIWFSVKYELKII